MKQMTEYVSKKFTVTRERSEFGTSSIDIECPFCQTNTTAYIWSLAGSGKKCPGCGAIHHWQGGITKKKLPPAFYVETSYMWYIIRAKNKKEARAHAVANFGKDKFKEARLATEKEIEDYLSITPGPLRFFS